MKTTQKKIFFADLDETLLTREKGMTPATVEAVKKLTDAGHYLAFSSGRPLNSIMEARELLPVTNHNLFYVANNGSLIVNAETGEHISEIRLTMEETAHVLKVSKEMGIHCHAYTDDSIVAHYQSPELTFYQKTIHLPVIFADDIMSKITVPPFKCLAISLDGREKLELLKEELTPWAKGHVSLICSTDRLLEMFPINAGKGAGLVHLAQHLNIPIENTMSAGDQDNDISMLEAAGLGVAMCNGSEGAKKAADVITKTDNNHDGLVPFLEDFFGI